MAGINPVVLAAGKVSGVSVDQDRCTVFKGIPFAAPPVGAGRWRAPQPESHWQELRGDRYGSACLQPLHSADHLLGQFGFAPVPECGISENCLFLNVWTPARRGDEKLPVIVWLYGGGFRVGAGSHPVSEGEGIARQGAILVSFNYRLGALGFLAHPALTAESGTSGAYALQDCIAALRWVKRNIAAFGGDPDCVTMFGQSAGAALVNVLMVMPEAQGLAHRAIVHSSGRMRGGPMGVMRNLAAAEQEGAKFLSSLGANDLHAMRNLPADRLYGVPRQWAPIVDGTLVPESPQTAFDRGAQMRIPLLCGFTGNEAASFPAPEWQSQTGFSSFVRQSFGDTGDWLIDHYRVNSDTAALAASYELRRDISFAWQPWQMALSHSATSGQPTYLFEFAARPPLPADAHYHDPLPPGGYGSYHGAELWYVFDSQDKQPAWQWSGADHRLAETMCAQWVQFARSGNPNLNGQPQWPAYTAQDRRAMRFDRARDSIELSAGHVSNHAALMKFETQFANRSA